MKKAIALSDSRRGFTPIIILVLVLVVALVAGAYYLGTKNVSFTPVSSPTTSQAPTGTLANWKTYTNLTRKYSIKYPTDWNIDTSMAETDIQDARGSQLVIMQEDYKIIIYLPSAYGPGMCVFDDQTEANPTEMTTYCHGQFKDITSDRFRRLVTPQSLNNHVRWVVYSKGSNGSYATIPPISYDAPLQYNQNTINIMDQILSTFQFTQ